VSGVKKSGFGHIFGRLVAFSDCWRLLAGQHKAPVNWDRWAALEEQLVNPIDKPI